MPLNLDSLIHSELEKMPESRRTDVRYRAVVDLLLKGYSHAEIMRKLSDFNLTPRTVRRFEDRQRKHTPSFRNIRELGLQAKKAIEAAATAGRVVGYENFQIEENGALIEDLKPSLASVRGLEVPDGEVKFQTLLRINGLLNTNPEARRQDLIQSYNRGERVRLISWRWYADEPKLKRERPSQRKFNKAIERLQARERGEEHLLDNPGKSAWDFEDARILKTHFNQ